MITLLETSNEAERICDEFDSRGLTLHKTPQKNWDHHLLLKLLESAGPDIRILDLGSGGGITLQLLRQQGFRNLQGMDFEVPPVRLRNRLTRLLKPSAFQPCFHILKGDMLDSGLPNGQWDLITCISVLEHGVDTEKFMRESARLLTPGGTLFATFDYWEDFQPEQHPGLEVMGRPWNIFNREKVARMIATAANFDLHPLCPGEIPPCREKTVSYAGQEYTFMALGLKKQA